MSGRIDTETLFVIALGANSLVAVGRDFFGLSAYNHYHDKSQGEQLMMTYEKTTPV